MANPSISIPNDLLAEVDDRRHSTTDRSEWIRQAIIARIRDEDADEWEIPEEWSEYVNSAEKVSATN